MAIRLEDIALRLEAIATRLEAIAIRGPFDIGKGSTIGLLGRVIVNGIEEKVPFLEFRFSLEGSILADADAAYASLLQRTLLNAVSATFKLNACSKSF
eukprot:g21765.t1